MKRIVLNIIVTATAIACPLKASAADDHFLSKVAPILQRRCLSCHNDAQHKGDLSLQTATSLRSDGYLDATDAQASHLLQVITPVRGKAEMPKNSDPLSPAEIATIKTWIEDGAVWPADLILKELKVTDFDWWSFRPITKPKVPRPGEREWIRTPIDAFVLQTLNDKQLAHSHEADRRTMIRRLTYDLTGLPPSPEQVAAFVEDSNPKAYEQLVDRLLDSKHYGERWARHWLDVVKYADTCGYDKDKLRSNAWPFRDYVIRSFNDDKPYARFIEEQIAGDVLFPDEPDSIPGLGFIAAGPWDFIGHVEVPESKIDGQVARNLDRDDMVSNTLNTFCSVTVQCARCHNHKFDPITQADYYGLQSIFAAVDRADRLFDVDPKVDRKRQQLTSDVTTIQNEIQTIESEIAKAGGPRLKELSALVDTLKKKSGVTKPVEYGYHSGISIDAESEKWVEIVLPELTEISRIVVRPCHDDFAGIGAGFGFPLRFKIEITSDLVDTKTTQWTVVRDHTSVDYPNPGLSAFEVSGIRVNVRRVRVTATRLATRSNDYILALAEIQAFDKRDRNAAMHGEVRSIDSIQAPVRWARKNLTDGLYPRRSDAAVTKQLENTIRKRVDILAAIETPARVRRRKKLQTALQEKRAQLDSLPKQQLVYAATTDFAIQGNFKPTMGKLRPVHVLHRGEILQPRKPAVPGVLRLDNTQDIRMPPGLKEYERRAALAKWLSDTRNPLVWRSIVNRVWQYHFGQGIVSTPNDFGRMGAEPTHPKLLDWLAATFRDGDQSFKQLHRMIVTSSVYRQSSQFNEANAKVDNGNRYLWRMNRRRLEAEEIRDSILSVSGALNTQRGGPGFYLFKLEKPQHSPHYEYHKFDATDPKSHRRSIYRFIVRSQPDPWMTTLDCADSSQSTPRRNETLTSLQALSLLNNQFNLVMAKRFAKRLATETPDLSRQVDQAILLVTQRPPTQSERTQMLEYAQNHGLTNLCRLLFNLSEFVYLD